MDSIRVAAFVACIAGMSTMSVAARAAPKVTVDDYARAESMLARNTAPLVDGMVGKVGWIDDGSVRYVEHDRDGDRYLRFDLASGKATPLFDQRKLAAALAKASGKPFEAGKLSLDDVRDEGDAHVRIAYSGVGYRCDLATRRGRCDALPRPPEPAVRSPDGKREAFIRDWNLWLRDVASGKETQLTTDGARDYGYATDNAGWKHSDNAVLAWSPDSGKIATFRQDQRKTRTMTLVDTGVGAPRVEQWKYPFAGDKEVTTIERVIIDLGGDAPRTIRLRMPPDQHRSTCADNVACDGGWDDVQWAGDGKSLAFVSTDRGHKSATLRVADAATGVVRDVYTETVKTQYQGAPALSSVNWRYLPESGEFLWFSQRSDWGHLYLRDLSTGKLKRQVTRGAWNATRVDHVDQASRTLWFEGVGREPGDPYFVHYYKVGLDGGDVQLLTPEDANHVVTVADDGRHFVDVYSTISTAPVAVLRDADGRRVAELARADLARLRAAGWVPPQSFTVKARDGRTDLYGQMFKPSGFDPSKRYPVITYIYPGPQVGSIRTRSFAPAHGDNQALAELGFVVVAIDGMGTPLRSKSFQDAWYGDMIDNTLPDQVAALKQLGERYPWIDTGRAGIWGHSGGGNATATAMFRYPGVWKVGIAESGNHDNLTYEDDWGERYQGLLRKGKDGTSNYSGQDNASLAKNLVGKLFLVHGLMDDNVPPQNTLQVVDALVKANKDFDLLLLPHARHGYGIDADYVMRRRWDYFVRNLLGAEPPKEFEIKPAK
jgi:dipeptidyl aminopeptidase/acylaminoacyl peptidase